MRTTSCNGAFEPSISLGLAHLLRPGVDAKRFQNLALHGFLRSCTRIDSKEAGPSLYRAISLFDALKGHALDVFASNGIGPKAADELCASCSKRFIETSIGGAKLEGGRMVTLQMFRERGFTIAGGQNNPSNSATVVMQVDMSPLFREVMAGFEALSEDTNAASLSGRLPKRPDLRSEPRA